MIRVKGRIQRRRHVPSVSYGEPTEGQKQMPSSSLPKAVAQQREAKLLIIFNLPLPS